MQLWQGSKFYSLPCLCLAVGPGDKDTPQLCASVHQQSGRRDIYLPPNGVLLGNQQLLRVVMKLSKFSAQGEVEILQRVKGQVHHQK